MSLFSLYSFDSDINVVIWALAMLYATWVISALVDAHIALGQLRWSDEEVRLSQICAYNFSFVRELLKELGQPLAKKVLKV